MSGLIDGIEAELDQEQDVQIDDGGGQADQSQSEEGGQLNFDWRTALPEDIRNDPSLAGFKELPDLAKSYLNAKKLIGKKTIGMPDKNASEEERSQFFNALGRPENVEGYELKRHAELPAELIDAAGTERLAARAHQLGISKEQLQGLTEEFDQQLLEGHQARQAELRQHPDMVIAQLRQEWGNEFKVKAIRAEQTLNTIDNDGVINREGLKNNPEVMKLLDMVASRVLGDSLPDGPGGVDNLEAQLAEIRNSPAYNNEQHADHDTVMRRFRILSQQYSAQRKKR